MVSPNFLVALLLACACARAPVEDDEQEQNLDGGCGVERWPIKTASDANAFQIVTTPVVSTTIAALSAFPAQSGTEFDRITPTELTVYQLTDVKLVEYRRETDSDYHLVVGDGTRTMIVELPDPACVPAGSPLLASITNARAQFDAKHAPVPNTPVSSSETLTVTGVGFFDVFHSQTGVAPNAFELHPLLSVCFGAGCAGTPPPPPPPASHGCSSVNPGWLALLTLAALRRRQRTANSLH